MRYHCGVDCAHSPEAVQLLKLLEAGGEPEEGALARTLRRPSCPGELVERLSRCGWILGSPRLLKLVVRHPRCPRHFAWEAVARVGWNDLVEVARDPRTPPAVRAQCERKLIERVATLTLGERTALARVAPRSLIGVMIASEEPRCIAALLDNRLFTESDALRVLIAESEPPLHHGPPSSPRVGTANRDRAGSGSNAHRAPRRCPRPPAGLDAGGTLRAGVVS